MLKLNGMHMSLNVQLYMLIHHRMVIAHHRDFGNRNSNRKERMYRDNEGKINHIQLQLYFPMGKKDILVKT